MNFMEKITYHIIEMKYYVIKLSQERLLTKPIIA